MEETVFAHIIKKDIPADIVYEDDVVMAFLDNNPVNPGHTLVIPKTPYKNIFDIDTETLQRMIALARTIAHSLKEIQAAEGINIIMNNEDAAGQEVDHAHIHVIPRQSNDHRFTSPERPDFSPEILADVYHKLTASLS